MTVKRLVQLAVGLLISGGFLWLIATAIPVDEVGAALSRVDLLWAAAGVAMFAVGYLCRIRRWQLMLANDNPLLPFHRAAIPFMISIAANNVLPFRIGDVMRAFAFSRWLGAPSSAVLATLLAERFLDLLALLAALALASVALGIGEGRMAALFGVGLGGIMAAAAFIAFALLYPHMVQPLAHLILRRLAPILGGLGEKLTRAVDAVFDAMRRLTRSGRTLALIGWSAAAWGAEAGLFYCCALAVPAMTEPAAAWLAMPVGTLSTLLPSSPGYVGTFHYFVIKAVEALGNPPVAAAAFAFLAHIVLWLTATLTGGVCFAVWSFAKIRE